MFYSLRAAARLASSELLCADEEISGKCVCPASRWPRLRAAGKQTHKLARLAAENRREKLGRYSIASSPESPVVGCERGQQAQQRSKWRARRRLAENGRPAWRLQRSQRRKWPAKAAAAKIIISASSSLELRVGRRRRAPECFASYCSCGSRAPTTEPQQAQTLQQRRQSTTTKTTMHDWH